MLQAMRRHSQSFIIYIMFGILIFVFAVSFGLPTSQCNPQTADQAAEVGDYEIDAQELNSAVMRATHPNVPRDEAELASVRRRVLYNMVTTLLLADAAEEAGYRVSDEELRQYIVDWERDNPDARHYLPRDNAFDREQYENMLDYFGTTTDDYERWKRREILARNYLSTLQSSVVVSDLEMRARFEAQSSGVRLKYAKLEPRNVLHLIDPVTDAEVAAFIASDMDAVKGFYDENRETYDRPATVRLQELVIQKNEKLFRTPGTETDREATPEDRYATMRKAVVEDAMSFEEAGEKYNEALSNRADGGDKGLREVENLTKAERDAIKDLEIGGVKEFETDINFHIIKLVERNEAVSSSLDKVQNEIARKLIQDSRANALLDELAKSLHEKVKAGEDFDTALSALFVAKADSIVPIEGDTAPAEGDAAPAEGDAAPAEGDAAPAEGDAAPAEGDAAPAEGDAAPAEGGAAPAEGDAAPAEGDAAPAEGDAAPAEGDAAPAEGDAAPAEGDAAPAEGDAAPAEGDAAPAEGPVAEGDAAVEPSAPIRPAAILPVVSETDQFNLRGRAAFGDSWSAIPGIGDSPELARALDGLEEAGALAPEVYTLEDGSRVVAALAERVTGSDEDFEKQRDQISRALRAERSQMLLGDWKAIISLSHPDPTETPYGPWIQTQFELARKNGDFQVNSEFLGKAPSPDDEESEDDDES